MEILTKGYFITENGERSCDLKKKIRKYSSDKFLTQSTMVDDVESENF